MIKKYTGKLPPKGAKGLEVVACINDFMHYFVEVVEEINKLSQEPKEKATVVEYNDSELKRAINLLESNLRVVTESFDAERKCMLAEFKKELDKVYAEIEKLKDKVGE